MRFTLVTLNTWKGEGDYPARLSATGDLLERLDPDIVFLQEVFAIPGTGVDTVASLRRRLGLYAACHPARRKFRKFQNSNVGSTSGLAVLSRFQPQWGRSVALPSDPADGERIAQIVGIDPDGSGTARLSAVNLHLTHLRDARTLRQSQFAAAYDAAAAQSVAPVIVAGDFNDHPDGHWLEEAMGQSGARIRNGRDDPGISERSTTLIEGVGGEGPRCIDHFVSGSRTVRFREISHHGDAAVSDHFAVRAVIDVGV